jgi:hypothetical protein
MDPWEVDCEKGSEIELDQDHVQLCALEFSVSKMASWKAEMERRVVS